MEDQHDPPHHHQEHHEQHQNAGDMSVFHCIKTRRTIRKFKDEFVPWEKLVAVIEAARYTPTAGNLQNWKLVLIKEDAQKAKLAKACIEQKWIAQAAFLIIVVGEPKSAERFFGPRANFYTIQNCGAVIQTMLLAAHSVGLGAAWIGAFDEEMIRDIINHAEYNHVQAVVALGVPDEHPETPLRNRLETMIYFGRWFNRRRFAPYGWQSLNLISAVQNTRKYVEKMANHIKQKSDEFASKIVREKEENKHAADQSSSPNHQGGHAAQPAQNYNPPLHSESARMNDQHAHAPSESFPPVSPLRGPTQQMSANQRENSEFPPLEDEWYHFKEHKKDNAPHNRQGHH